jgi:hypothetical protein
VTSLEPGLPDTSIKYSNVGRFPRFLSSVSIGMGMPWLIKNLERAANNYTVGINILAFLSRRRKITRDDLSNVHERTHEIV